MFTRLNIWKSHARHSGGIVSTTLRGHLGAVPQGRPHSPTGRHHHTNGTLAPRGRTHLICFQLYLFCAGLLEIYHGHRTLTTDYMSSAKRSEI